MTKLDSSTIATLKQGMEAGRGEYEGAVDDIRTQTAQLWAALGLVPAMPADLAAANEARNLTRKAVSDAEQAFYDGKWDWDDSWLHRVRDLNTARAADVEALLVAYGIVDRMTPAQEKS